MYQGMYEGTTLVVPKSVILGSVIPSENAARSERAAFARDQAASESRDLLF